MRVDLAAHLGTIRWPLAPLWSVAPRVDNKNAGLTERNLLSLSYGNVIRKSIAAIGGLRPESYETYNIIESGDVVLRMTDLQNDKKSIRSGFAAERGIITSAYITVRPDVHKTEPRYVAAVLRAYDIKKAFYEMGAGVRQNLGYAELADLPIPLPDPDTQRAIADYLDRETGEIDAMLGKMDELTAQLSALHRTHLVRLGKRLTGPAVGSSTRVGLLLTKQNRVIREDDGVVTAFRDGQVALRSRRREDGFTMSFTEHGYQGVEPGDFVFHGLDGFAGAVGVSEDRGKVSPVYHVCKATSLASERFMSWALRALSTNGFLEAYSSSTRQRSIDFRNWTTFAGLPINFLPIDEQQRIADHLDEVTGKIDAMRAKVAELKALLIERRAALITDVVTGRKDVA